MPPPRPLPPGRSRAAGFSLLEILGAVLLLTMGLLTHVSTTVAGHRMTHGQRARSEVLQVARDVLERLRADEDWPTLYARLRYLEVQAAAGTGPVRLDDGRTAWPVTTYFPDYVAPSTAPPVHMLVEVPPPQPADGGGSPVLREDQTLVRFGLPSDLNGDGVVDGAARDDDYLLLPVAVLLHWNPANAPSCTTVLPAWLRGRR